MEQINVLNDAYQPAGLTFILVDIIRTTNATLFEDIVPGSAEQNEMKQELRQGGAADLNVYTVG